MSDFACEPLTKLHDRQRFRCGVPELDAWLQQRARQDQERRVAAAYVMVPQSDPTRIVGFYTLSAMSIVLESLPETLLRKLPRYPVVPAILIGRLARDLDFPGTGGKLLADALQRALLHAVSIAAATVVVDSKDESASQFYRHFGFESLANDPRRLFLPMATLEKLFKA